MATNCIYISLWSEYESYIFELDAQFPWYIIYKHFLNLGAYTLLFYFWFYPFPALSLIVTTDGGFLLLFGYEFD
jgi:hypothetical protein